MTIRSGLTKLILAASLRGLGTIAPAVPLVAGLALTGTSASASEYTPLEKPKALDALKEVVKAAAGSGKKVEVWITVFGSNQKTELVKADEKFLTVKVQGNAFDQGWDKVSPEQLMGVGKACLQEDGKRALKLADYCIAYGFREKADEALTLAAQYSKDLGAELSNRVKFIQDPSKKLTPDDSFGRVAGGGVAPRSDYSSPAGGGASSANSGPVVVNLSGFPQKNEIDKFIADKLVENGVNPSRTCTDDEFIRRVYLDLLGCIPSTFAVKAFLSDGNPKKREALVDSLLKSDRYGAHWATVWGDLLREHSNSQQGEGTYYGSYRNWLRKALNDNLPYDQFMTELITASGRADQNGAVNFFLRDEQNRVETVNTISHAFMGTRMACAQCHDHPFDKWEQRDFYRVMSFLEPRVKVETDGIATVVKLKNANIPADIKAKIQPFIEKAEAELKERDAEWAEQEEARKAAIKEFMGGAKKDANAKDTKEAKKEEPKVAKAKKGGNGVYNNNAYNEMNALIEKDLGKDRAEAFRNIFGNNRANRVVEHSGGDYDLSNEIARGQGGRIDPQFPWDPTKKADPKNPSRRAELAKFIAGHPQFAKVQANRLWASIFGRGIVDPVDDFRPKNPPSHPELLDFLGKYLVDNYFDNKKLLRLILTSATYERSSIPDKTNDKDITLFSHRVLRRMSAEQINDAILIASAQAPLNVGLENLKQSTMAGMGGLNMGGGGMGMEKGGMGMKKGGDAMDMMMGGGGDADVKWAFDQPTPARLGSFMNTFNQPTREEFIGTRDPSVTITQALELFNGRTINDTVRFKNNRFVQKLLDQKLDPGTVVSELYLNTLSRMPSGSELSVGVGYIGQNSRAKIEDLHWALMNTREFMFIK